MHLTHWPPVVESIAFKTIMSTHASIVGPALACFDQGSGCSVFQSRINWVGDRYALHPMKICRCHAVILQLKPIVLSHVLDRSH